MQKRKEPSFTTEPEKASLSILKEEDRAVSCTFEKETAEDPCNGYSFSECRFNSISFTSRMKNCTFADVIFSHCDFSNITMEGSAYYRVVFDHCRLTGTDLSLSYFQDVLLENCAMDYSNFNGSKWKNGKMQECQSAEASFSLCSFRNMILLHTDFTSSEWLNTPLNGLDFSACTIEGIMVNPENLKGAVVSRMQAASLAQLLGINVKD